MAADFYLATLTQPLDNLYRLKQGRHRNVLKGLGSCAVACCTFQ